MNQGVCCPGSRPGIKYSTSMIGLRPSGSRRGRHCFHCPEEPEVTDWLEAHCSHQLEDSKRCSRRYRVGVIIKHMRKVESTSAPAPLSLSAPFRATTRA